MSILLAEKDELLLFLGLKHQYLYYISRIYISSCRKMMQRSGKDFSILLVLPAGIYHYKFIVDGDWRYIPELPFLADETGHACNILDVNVCICHNVGSASSFFLVFFPYCCSLIIQMKLHLTNESSKLSFFMVHRPIKCTRERNIDNSWTEWCLAFITILRVSKQIR